CKGRPVVQRASEAAEIEQAFGSAVEGNSHAVEQVNDAGRGIAHVLYRGLIREEVATVNSVIKMLPGRVAFAFKVLGSVDSSLGANGVRPFHRDDGEQVDVTAEFGDFDDRRQTCQSTAYHDDFRISCHIRSGVPLCTFVWPSCPLWRVRFTAEDRTRQKGKRIYRKSIDSDVPGMGCSGCDKNEYIVAPPT